MSERRAPYLPSGYSLETEGDFLRIVAPSGRRVPGVLIGKDVDPHVVEEIAWEKKLDAEEKIGECERALGRSGGSSLWSWVERHLRPMYEPEELQEKMREFSEMHLLDTMKFFRDLEGSYPGGADGGPDDARGRVA